MPSDPRRNPDRTESWLSRSWWYWSVLQRRRSRRAGIGILDLLALLAEWGAVPIGMSNRVACIGASFGCEAPVA
ncbi:MAG: hypothetical protein O6768_02520, partial [Planctomycetota bacterium]|nr:hypothetical protein [Planctomycetota bacterium]